MAVTLTTLFDWSGFEQGYHLRVFECLGTATRVQRKHDALPAMLWLHILRHTAGDVIKATILVNIRAEMACHTVYPHLH